MKLTVNIITIAVLTVLSGSVAAESKVEIEWDKPEKYTDVRPTTESRKRFRDSTFKRLNEYMNELAERLPPNQSLRMKVTNLDLAGHVWPASHIGLGLNASDVRVIKEIDIPRINFTYQLLTADGEMVQQGDVRLKDMTFMDRSNRSIRSERLRYEKNMLQSWFNKEFQTQLNSKSDRAGSS